MDEFTVDAFVNRDEPIPILVVDADLSDSLSDRERTRDRLKAQGKTIKDSFKKVQGKASDTGSSMQDRLLEKYGYRDCCCTHLLIVVVQTTSTDNTDRRRGLE